jgi:hypothetical protein
VSEAAIEDAEAVKEVAELAIAVADAWMLVTEVFSSPTAVKISEATA